jgi:hypothetical protein
MGVVLVLNESCTESISRVLVWGKLIILGSYHFNNYTTMINQSRLISTAVGWNEGLVRPSVG